MLPNQFEVSSERLEPVFDAAGHVDEGTVHTWLDGAFDTASATRVEEHVATCASCGAMVAEARGLMAASSRILGGLDTVPGGVVPMADAARTAMRVAAGSAPRSRWTQGWTVRAAAALFLVVGGTVVLRDRGTAPRPASPQPVAAEPMPVAADTAVVAAAPPRADTPSVAAPATAPKAMARTAEAAANRVAAKAARPQVVAEAADLAAGAAPRPTAPSLVAQAAPAPAPPAVASTAPVAALRVAAASEMTAPVEARPLVITGFVRDAATQLPLANVGVAVMADASTNARQAGAITDVGGRYTITLATRPAGGTVYLTARLIGYAMSRVQRLAPGDTVNVSFTMARTTMSLSQTVVTAERSRPERASNAPASIATVAGAPPAPMGRIVAVRPINSGERVAADNGKAGTIRRMNREQYDRIEDNPFLGVKNNPLSTFSIDVDRASYTNVRRFLQGSTRPPKDAVRIEEFINYFPYQLPEPRGNDPVSISSEVIAAPWQPQHKLVRVALQAKRIETANLPPNNLVFLLDVSGSMNEWNKLPLVKQALRLLVDQLRPQDRVAIVTYAGAAGLVLPSTSGDEKVRILSALDRLEAGGSTAGGAGIDLAYRTAREHFLPNGNNRVILATDGDFNVGPSSDSELERMVEQRRREGTYLTVLGFGTGNYQASKMEKLAKVGNGNAAYVDNISEARKVLVEEMGATLLTVANDVKLQVEFNPAAVQAYRLIGYENRLLATEDFNDDTKDAGDIGAGHQVTALYEVVPVGVRGTVNIRGIDSLRYVTPDRSMGAPASGGADELLFVKLRYKRPGQSTSQLMSHAVPSRTVRASQDMRFVSAVASFGMLLRDSEYKGNSSAEFVQLVERWRALGVTAGERR